MDPQVKVVVRTVEGAAGAGDAVVLDIAGDVTSTAEDSILGSYEKQARQGHRKFVLNFSEVEYINSSGMAIIINLVMKTRKQDQRLSLFGLNRHFQKMFHIVGIDRYTTLCHTEGEALESLR